MDALYGNSLERPNSSSQRIQSRIPSQVCHSRLAEKVPNASLESRAYSPHPIHQYHHTACLGGQAPSRLLSPRPASQLRRDDSMDSVRQSVASGYLQQELEKQRKAESDRISNQAAALSRSKTAFPVTQSHGRASQILSTHSRESEGYRPSSSDTDSTRHPEMGLREMRRTIDQLTNENFNLKFELYHRRETQPKLEAQVEALQSEKAQLEEMNDKLLADLEKRDKAVQEAVAMIVMLEAKTDGLLQDLKVVQDVQPDPGFNASAAARAGYPTPTSTVRNISGETLDESKLLARMPSFMSEASQTTEILRQVYLSVAGSALSLDWNHRDRTKASSSDAARGARPSSGARSSESLASAYGPSLPDIDEPIALGGVGSGSSTVQPSIEGLNVPRSRAAQNGRQSAPRPPAKEAGQLPFMHEIVQGSPLQRIERLDQSIAQRKGGSRPPSQGTDASSQRNVSNLGSPARRRLRDATQESMRKLATEAPGGVRLHSQALPPTPDTISSTILRRMKNSDDTLVFPEDTCSEDSFIIKSSMPEVAPKGRTTEPSTGTPLETGPEAILSRKTQHIRCVSEDSDRETPLQRLSVPNRGGFTDDDVSSQPDAPSLVSSDIWMRAGDRDDDVSGRESPDLFGFPTSAVQGGWTPDAMYGPNTDLIQARAATRNWAAVSAQVAPRADSFTGTRPLPPPERRSSVHVSDPRQTFTDFSGISPAAEAAHNHGQISTKREDGRHKANAARREGLKTPIQATTSRPPAAGANVARNSEGPTIAQANPRSGLNKLFRRSMGGGASTKPELSHLVAPPSSRTRNEEQQDVPASWTNRRLSVFDDDRTGATPPPILRNPRGNRRTYSDAAPSLPQPQLVADDLSSNNISPREPFATTADAHVGRNSSDNGSTPVPPISGRRKWLPSFRRSNSISIPGKTT